MQYHFKISIEKIIFALKRLEFEDNFDVFHDFFLKTLAKIEVLTCKFQGLSIIQDTAKIKNANFEGAKIGGLVYSEMSFCA